MTASIATADARPRTEGFYTAFLSSQGRVLHDVFVYPDTLVRGKDGGPDALRENFLIEVDAAEAERLQRHIRRYKLRAKFDVRLLDPGEMGVWHAWDDAGGAALEAGLAKAATGAEGSGAVVLRDPRAPGLGHRILRLGDAPPAALEQLGPASEEAYRVRRYLRGVAEGQDELACEHALPLESNIDVMGGVDFHKGCYVGQELTIRTKHRGVVRKRILPCAVYPRDRAAPDRLRYRGSRDEAGGHDGFPEGTVAAETIPRDTSIGRVGKKGRSAGKWLRGVGNVGLALCRLEIMTDVVLPGETGSATFDPANEFVLEWGGDDGAENGGSVKVKAFVPEWLRAGLAQGQQQS